MIYDWKARINRIVDGDTITIDLDQGFGDWKLDFAVRMAHYDTPERGTAEAKAATEYLRKLLEPAFTLDAKGKLPLIYCVTIKPKDKWQRYLAEIYLKDGLNPINQQMIDSGHGIPYEGGAR